MLETVTGGDPTLIFNSAAANRSGLIKYQDNGTNVGRIEYVHNGDRIDFRAGSATGSTMSVLNAGVGVNTTSLYTGSKLSVNGSIVQSNNGQHVIGTFGTSGLQLIGVEGGDCLVGTMGSSEPLLFRTASQERMRINADGYLLVGKSNTTFTTVGTEIRGGNLGARVIRSNAEPLVLHRIGSNGQILNLYDQSTHVGSIGSADSDNLFISGKVANHAGLKFGTLAIIPIVAESNSDNTVNLGMGSYRFHDAHLGGTVKVGEKVGIGTTNPQAKLQVDLAGIDTYAVNTSATSQAQVAAFAAATFRSARFTVQITNTTDSTYHVTEILLIHDGTTPAITEYATIFTGTAGEATFDADITGGNVRLLATPASADTMQFRVVQHSILV
jgi:hypothetical protein